MIYQVARKTISLAFLQLSALTIDACCYSHWEGRGSCWSLLTLKCSFHQIAYNCLQQSSERSKGRNTALRFWRARESSIFLCKDLCEYWPASSSTTINYLSRFPSAWSCWNKPRAADVPRYTRMAPSHTQAFALTKTQDLLLKIPACSQ